MYNTHRSKKIKKQYKILDFFTVVTVLSTKLKTKLSLENSLSWIQLTAKLKSGIKILGWDFSHLTSDIYRTNFSSLASGITLNNRVIKVFLTAELILRQRSKKNPKLSWNWVLCSNHRQLPLMKMSVYWSLKKGEMNTGFLRI